MTERLAVDEAERAGTNACPRLDRGRPGCLAELRQRLEALEHGLDLVAKDVRIIRTNVAMILQKVQGNRRD